MADVDFYVRGYPVFADDDAEDVCLLVLHALITELIEEVAEADDFAPDDDDGSDCGGDENDVENALRAAFSPTLNLPDSATFAALRTAGVRKEPAAAASGSRAFQQTFDEHLTYELPCDHGCAASLHPDKATSADQGLVDTLHCFTLCSRIAQPLNMRLRDASLAKEAAAYGIRDEASKDSGVLNSNWGGYQSQGTIFDDCADPAEHESLRACRELHAIASVAMDALCGSCAPTAADDGGAADAALHAAYAWINVNRESDLNFLHMHKVWAPAVVHFPTLSQPCNHLALTLHTC